MGREILYTNFRIYSASIYRRRRYLVYLSEGVVRSLDLRFTLTRINVFVFDEIGRPRRRRRLLAFPHGFILRFIKLYQYSLTSNKFSFDPEINISSYLPFANLIIRFPLPLPHFEGFVFFRIQRF